MPLSWLARLTRLKPWSTWIAGARGLAQDGGHELLLVIDPGQVGRREGMPVPGVLQGGDAVDVMDAGGQAQAAVGVVHGERQADVDSAERVDDLDEAQEVDLDVVVDGQAGRRRDGRHHQLRAAQAEGRVDLVHAVAGNADPGIAGQADDLDVTVIGRDVNQHERVGVRADVMADMQLALLQGSQPGPLVDAGHQDVQRPALRRARGAGAQAAEAAGDVGGHGPRAA
jgi:hypothetical protein